MKPDRSILPERDRTPPPVKLGDRFGRLTVVAVIVENQRRIVVSDCDCGGVSRSRLCRVRDGYTQSCGCLRGRFSYGGRATRHGHAALGTESPTYRSWSSMKDRCHHRSNPSWPQYGGRGISVCERWQRFDEFLADMGERPAGHTLDRIDNDGHYTPDNCRWATLSMQAQNRRDNRLLAHNGKRQSVAAWAEEIGLSQSVIRRRLRRGWSDQRTLTTPVRRRGGSHEA